MSSQRAELAQHMMTLQPIVSQRPLALVFPSVKMRWMNFENAMTKES